MTGDDRDTLTHAAASLDEVHGLLEQAIAATRTELVLVRLALVRDDGGNGGGGSSDGTGDERGVE